MAYLDEKNAAQIWDVSKNTFLDKDGNVQISEELATYLGLGPDRSRALKDILRLSLNPGGITFPFSTEIS